MFISATIFVEHGICSLLKPFFFFVRGAFDEGGRASGVLFQR